MIRNYLKLPLKRLLFSFFLLSTTHLSGQWIDTSYLYTSFTSYSPDRLDLFNNIHLSQNRVYTDLRFVYRQGVPTRYPLMLAFDKQSGALVDTFSNPHDWLIRGDIQSGFSFFGDYGFYHQTIYGNDSVRGNFYDLRTKILLWTTNQNDVLSGMRSSSRSQQTVNSDSTIWGLDVSGYVYKVNIKDGALLMMKPVDSVLNPLGISVDSVGISGFWDVNDSLLGMGLAFITGQNILRQNILFKKNDFSLANISSKSDSISWNRTESGNHLYTVETKMIDTVNNVFKKIIVVYDLEMKVVDTISYEGPIPMPQHINSPYEHITFLKPSLFMNGAYRLLNFQYPKDGFDTATQSFFGDFGNNLVLYDSTGSEIYNIHLFNHHRLYSDRLERLVLDDDGSVYAIKYLQRDNHVRSNTIMRIAPDGSNATLSTPDYDGTQEMMNFQLYPNPSADEIHFSGMLPSGTYRMRLFTVAGQPVMTRSFQTGDLTGFSVAHLSPGLYFWRLETDSGQQVASGKLLKE